MSVGGSDSPPPGSKDVSKRGTPFDDEDGDDYDEMDTTGMTAEEIKALDPKRHARQQHNALERRRRDNIKDMYSYLRETVPDMQNERASRAQILKKAIDSIEEKQDLYHQKKQELDRIKATNADLEAKVLQLLQKKQAVAAANQEKARMRAERLANGGLGSGGPSSGASTPASTDGQTVKEWVKASVAQLTATKKVSPISSDFTTAAVQETDKSPPELQNMLLLAPTFPRSKGVPIPTSGSVTVTQASLSPPA